MKATNHLRGFFLPAPGLQSDPAFALDRAPHQLLDCKMKNKNSFFVNLLFKKQRKLTVYHHTP